jgi:allophanate hydrolase subunit 2
MNAFRALGAGLFREVRQPVYGRQDLGYSPGGPQDRWSVQVGNILLGNDDFAPALEIVYPPRLECAADSLFILTGAPRRNAEFLTASAGGSTVALQHGVVTLARKGDRIFLGRAEYGFRTYLCFRPCEGLSAARCNSLVGRARPPHREICTWPETDSRIRVTEGPEHADLTNPEAFLGQPWRTTAGMSDMGIRLAPLGEWQLVPASRDMVSQPVNDGTIQLTPSGPIVLMRERPTIGGYPRIFNVIGPDVDLLAQYGPNEVIRFKRISRREATALSARRAQGLDRLRAVAAK